MKAKIFFILNGITAWCIVTNLNLTCYMRHHIKAIVLLSYLLFAFLLVNAQVNRDRPNIIFILADDLGMGDVSFFNKDGKIKTPHIDQIG